MGGHALMPIIETDRLQLREFTVSDAPDLFALNGDPHVMRYTGDEPFESVEAAADFVRHYTHYREHGFGRWAVLLKRDGAFIGWCGLKRNEQDLIDLGFRFLRGYWNQGYATEAAQACLDYGFRELGMETIIGRAAEANGASIRVLEKLGMAFWKQDDCLGIPDSRYYQIHRPAQP
ncbi:MAG: GNAT family N-acetyltransferase [Bacteroidota bacterium]